MPIIGLVASSFVSFASDFVRIATTQISTATSTITFSSIPTNYSQLQIRISGKGNANANYGGAFYLRMNGDSSANYAWQWSIFYGDLSQNSNRTNNESEIFGGTTPLSGSSFTNLFGYATIDIFNPDSTTQNKVIHGDGGFATSVANQGERTVSMGLWGGTAAVTSISLRHPNDWQVGSVATLYGIEKA